MDGAHDMGGMHGFGPVAPERDEPVFHEAWEGHVFAACVAAWSLGLMGGDEGRHAIERMGSRAYLSSSYYARWLAMLETLLVEHGTLSSEELARRLAAVRRDPAAYAPSKTGDEDLARRLLDDIGADARSDRPAAGPPRFAPGDRVRAVLTSTPGHTRLPRYVRGRAGEVVAHHGSHVFPDASAHGLGEQPKPLYTVRFAARELWGPQAPAGDGVHVDLWEPYLQPA